MSIAAISSITPAAGDFLAGEAKAPPKQQLDQDDFLKLLTTQLTSQDPLKPISDTQFIAQMANFSSLEQMRSLAEDFKAFSGAQQIASAQNLLGTTVTLNADDEEITGPVSEVTIESGLPRLIVNGKNYDPADVIRILSSATPAPAK